MKPHSPECGGSPRRQTVGVELTGMVWQIGLRADIITDISELNRFQRA
jgi:hypothetical protein